MQEAKSLFRHPWVLFQLHSGGQVTEEVNLQQLTHFSALVSQNEQVLEKAEHGVGSDIEQGVVHVLLAKTM